MKYEEAIAYRRMINRAAEAQTDEAALESIDLFEKWDELLGVPVPAGKRVQDGGVLYRCVQAHTPQADWRPADTPALWTVVSLDEWPEWKQPVGSSDAYAKGDKVTHGGQHWVSDVDANVWEPGVFGWVLA